MTSTIYLVVGASRGIGEGLVEELSKNSSNHIIATVRKPVDFNKPNVETLTLDQTDADSVRTAAVKVKEIDVLILNAAIGTDDKLLSTSDDQLQRYLETNVIGPHRVLTAFLPALRARKTRKIIITSSISGSIEAQTKKPFGFAGPYSVTKAANNMQVVQYHNELENEGFTIVPIHPGWVATDMGGKDGVSRGALTVAQSTAGMVKVIENLKREDSAKFFVYDGSTLPW